MLEKVWKPACGKLCEILEILNLHAIATPRFPGASTSKHQLGPGMGKRKNNRRHDKPQQQPAAPQSKHPLEKSSSLQPGQTPLGMVAGCDPFC